MRLEELERAHPEAEVQLWAEDEARRGLKPVIRRVWAPVGERPVARFKRGYKWTYLYGFVHPQSGEVYWLILPTVNTELFSIALNEFAREVGAGKDKRVLNWWWIRLGGTPAKRSRSRKGYTLSSCLPAPRSYNQWRGYGH